MRGAFFSFRGWYGCATRSRSEASAHGSIYPTAFRCGKKKLALVGDFKRPDVLCRDSRWHIFHLSRTHFARCDQRHRRSAAQPCRLAAPLRRKRDPISDGGEYMNRQPNDEGQDGIVLYVINLDSSSLPMSLDVPFQHELVGFTVFRSRSFEHGRERFCLHLGYFESTQRAEDALSVVRKHYPAAWISAAPESHLGSLDNTVNTEFRVLGTAYARVVTPASAPTAPAPVAAKAAASAVVKEPSLDAENRAPAPAVPPPQRYAVQLEWSLAPVNAAQVPRLAIFAEYHLYTVRMLREGSPQQGLRLGFFTSADAAFRVAEYVRPEYPGVGVVPVSDREYSRAIELARHAR
jgi:hypothetical protein